eukprot:Phypoly_transcript_14389.p1 GENE.Phypoly_transcript_14389~~Phypoly_transcript_14389.p1  ORF type:complete len:324 (+),score=28.19 Phypoly_transcript_14389:71-973(+)
MGDAPSPLYPPLGVQSQRASQNFGASNLQYYSQPSYGQPVQGQPGQGASVLDGLGSGIISQVGDAAFGPMGKHMMFTGKQLVNDNFGRFMTLAPLKYYFNVNNSYVINKMRLLMCPFFHKQWKRRIIRVGEVDSYAFPREDINAPDLYIPAMAFVTYILLVGFVYGTNAQFTPELLGLTASKGLAILGLEVMVVKMMFYLFNCGGVSLLDLSAYSGYKFVGLVANILTGFAVGGYLYFVASIYFGLVIGFFMMRTLRLVLVLESTRAAVEVPSNSSAKNYFLLLVAIFQLVVVYFLGIVV